MTRRHLTLIPAVLLLAALALPACSSSSKSTACTTIGCQSGATLNLDAFNRPGHAVTSATVCIDNHCETQVGTAANPVAIASAKTALTSAVVVTVKVVLRGAGGRVLASSSVRAPLRKVQPNGPKCEPICYEAAVHLTPAGKLAAGAA